MNISSFETQRIAHKNNKSKMYQACSRFRFLKMKTLGGNNKIPEYWQYESVGAGIGNRVILFGAISFHSYLLAPVTLEPTHHRNADPLAGFY